MAIGGTGHGDYTPCEHPQEWRVWTSNWLWYCGKCGHREEAPHGAIGVIRHEDLPG